jgi:hypothetical protein
MRLPEIPGLRPVAKMKYHGCRMKRQAVLPY